MSSENTFYDKMRRFLKQYLTQKDNTTMYEQFTVMREKMANFNVNY